MSERTPEISMKAPLSSLQRDLLPQGDFFTVSDIEWSRSRTMTLSSMYGSAEINCCASIIAFIWKWSKPLACVWIIAVESALLVNIYWSHAIYYVLSLTFISIPLLISSLYISCTSYQSITSRFDSDRITYLSGSRRKCLELLLLLPLLNVFIMLLPAPIVLIKKVHYTLNLQSLFILILSICMTLPQFILNVSYILSYNHITFFNWLQIITCVSTLSVFASFHYAHTYALDAIGEQTSMLNALKLQLFWSKFQYYAEIFFYIYFIVIILELIHCLPILFEYFYYHNVDLMTLCYILIAFNSAKFICFSHYIYNISVYKNTQCCCNGIRFVLFVLMFIPLPLFPFMTTTYKSLFDKRLLLIDQQNRIKARAKNKRITSDTIITAYADGADSPKIYNRKPTENASNDTHDDSSDETTSDDDIKQQNAHEKSPICSYTATESITEDLLTYHTMDSIHASAITGPAAHSCSINAGREIRVYHFEQHESMKSIGCQYMLLVLYLFSAYIGCNAWLMIHCGSVFCLGFITQIMIYVSFAFVMIASVLYSPYVLKRVLNRAQLVLIGDEDSLEWM